MKLVLKEQERRQTKSVRRESVDQSPRRQSVSQVTSEPRQSVAQKLSRPRQSLAQQQEKRTEKIDNLTEKIINTERTIQALAKERDGLVSNPNVKEEFAIYTEGIQLHRKQADNLYRQLETIDSKTATKLETKFADSPYGKVACPLTPKEISAIKVEKANEKFNQSYRNSSPEPKMNKNLRIDTGKTLSEKEKAAEQKKFIQETKRNLQKIESKLQKYQKRKKSIIGLIANAFQRKKIQGLKEKKTDLINKLEQPQKKPQKGILKPTFKEQVKKEVVNAVTEANRKFNETHKDISKEPYANRQPKIKFDAKTLINGMDKEEPSQKRDHTDKEVGKANHKVQTQSLQKKISPETQKFTLKDRINHAHRQTENNHLKQDSHSRNNRPQTSPSLGR
ncbi:hypothetical protein [Enterococcus mundtii]|uniref:hypothetical protein n=1 Tax=Enterococcus mundtii TaxID=53346 RepID=UPI00032DF8FD|nr:hypothetical protein [Enterococcus mundtii]EOH66286.1 hypothetical protein UAC_00022 [Enterococcus mundtii ATCC 882]EOU14086.1 hypothetical protein I587_02672 [Enterococcus mundtii ATCC 882]